MRTKTFLFVVAASVGTALTSPSALGQGNDFFVLSIPLSGTNGTVSADNTTATKEVGEPLHGGNFGGKSLWWKFTPPADGVLTLSTTNSAFDTLLGLYTGTWVSGRGLANLTTIAENDDAYDGVPGGFSLINQAVKAGQTYEIAVDGFGGAYGIISLSYSFVPAPVYRLAAGSTTGGGTLQLTTTNSLGGVSTVPATSGYFASNSVVALTAAPNANSQFDVWTNSVASLANPLTVVVTNNMNVTADFIAIVFTDGFESGNLSHLTWTTTGDAPWFVQTNVVAMGEYAARSGVITDSQSSSLILTTNFVAGTGSFDFKVSSEQYWDFLNFYVDGVLRQQWSGEVGWGNYSFPLTAGTHTLQWSYIKDPSGSSGLDAAFIDDVNLPLVNN